MTPELTAALMRMRIQGMTPRCATCMYFTSMPEWCEKHQKDPRPLDEYYCKDFKDVPVQTS